LHPPITTPARSAMRCYHKPSRYLL
jgi:hypothetical protein